MHHLNIARPTLLFVHSDCFTTAYQAASAILLPLSKIVVLDGSTSVFVPSQLHSYRSFDSLIKQGSLLPPVIEKPFKDGEAKTRIAFLAPSSGTTGVQKVFRIMDLTEVSLTDSMFRQSQFPISMLSALLCRSLYLTALAKPIRNGKINVSDLEISAVDVSELLHLVVPD